MSQLTLYASVSPRIAHSPLRAFLPLALLLLAAPALCAAPTNPDPADTTQSLALRYRDAMTSPTIVSYGRDARSCRGIHQSLRNTPLPPDRVRLFQQGGFFPYIVTLDLPAATVIKTIAPELDPPPADFQAAVEPYLKNWHPYMAKIADGGCVGFQFWRAGHIYYLAFWDAPLRSEDKPEDRLVVDLYHYIQKNSARMRPLKK